MDQITQLLKENKSVDGVSLFDHLQSLLHKIIHEPNLYTQNLDYFELVSDFIKKNSFKYKNPRTDVEVNNIKQQKGELNEYIKKCEKLISDFKKGNKNLNIRFPNLISDSQMLEWAGISFSEEETYRIYTSIRKLAEAAKCDELRFWGKILGSEKDYYVVEGITSNKFVDKLPQNAEQKGEGVNNYTYWVAHDVLEEWFELPLVTPDQIFASRKIKQIFTGNLNAQIKSYPPYPGKEKHLLKCQISRITSATVLAPRDLYKINEEVGKNAVEFTEEFKYTADYAELKSTEYWVHQQQYILNVGRCTYYEDKSLTEEEKEKQQEIQDKDPEIERFKGIGEEKSPYPVKEGEEEEGTNWIVREYGDTQQFNLIGKEDGTVGAYSVISLKNQTWPGAQLVASLKGWCNIYFGYGLKVNQNPFNPVQPDKVLIEEDDKEEHREPNPDKPIEQLEPDSDDEKKKLQDGGEENGEEDQ